MQSNNLPLKRFNVRVYGLLINELNQILVSDEAFLNGTLATKFPGGGLELGEGLIDGLKREFVEETGVAVEIKSHFYTTDFFVPSAIDDTTQVISVFYLVRPIGHFDLPPRTVQNDGRVIIHFKWMPIETLHPDDVTYAIEKKVVQLLKECFR